MHAVDAVTIKKRWSLIGRAKKIVAEDWISAGRDCEVPHGREQPHDAG